jgi:hypothetical protein
VADGGRRDTVERWAVQPGGGGIAKLGVVNCQGAAAMAFAGHRRKRLSGATVSSGEVVGGTGGAGWLNPQHKSASQSTIAAAKKKARPSIRA